MRKIFDYKELIFIHKNNKRHSSFPGYPIYADSEDIYSKFKNEKELNPEDVINSKELEYTKVADIENDLNAGSSRFDLDIPIKEFGDSFEQVGIDGGDDDFYYNSNCWSQLF